MGVQNLGYRSSPTLDDQRQIAALGLAAMAGSGPPVRGSSADAGCRMARHRETTPRSGLAISPAYPAKWGTLGALGIFKRSGSSCHRCPAVFV